MTTTKAQSQSEFLKIGVPYSPSSGGAAKIYRVDFSGVRPDPIANTVPLSEVLSKFDGDSELQEELIVARKSLARIFYVDEPQSLSALRLAAGMSQRQVAEQMKTSQSYIARIEAGTIDPGTEVVAKLAAVLGVDNAVALEAVIYQRNTRGTNNAG